MSDDKPQMFTAAWRVNEREYNIGANCARCVVFVFVADRCETSARIYKCTQKPMPRVEF